MGIDVDHPDKLITTGVFASSRNPIYVAFAMILAQGAMSPAPVARVWLLNVERLGDREPYLFSRFATRRVGNW